MSAWRDVCESFILAVDCPTVGHVMVSEWGVTHMQAERTRNDNTQRKAGCRGKALSSPPRAWDVRSDSVRRARDPSIPLGLDMLSSRISREAKNHITNRAFLELLSCRSHFERILNEKHAFPSLGKALQHHTEKRILY